MASLHISENLHPYLNPHFAPSAPCTPGFLHPCCEMIGVISPGPVSHGWLITLSEPSYKNSLQASLPRWDTASNDCEDVLWFTCFLFPSFLSFFFYCAARGRNLKTAAPEMCDTLRQHKSHLAFCCDSISCKTQRNVSPIFTWCCCLVLKSNLVAFEWRGERKNLAVPAASIHVAKQQERSYRSQYTATRKAVIGCRWLKPERWQDSLRDSPAELYTTSSWILFLLYFNHCLWCAGPKAKLSQVHVDMHNTESAAVLQK